MDWVRRLIDRRPPHGSGEPRVGNAPAGRGSLPTVEQVVGGPEAYAARHKDKAGFAATRAEISQTVFDRRTAYLGAVAFVEDYVALGDTEMILVLSGLNRGLWQNGDTSDPALSYDWCMGLERASSGDEFAAIPVPPDESGPRRRGDEWLDVLELFLEGIWRRIGDISTAELLLRLRRPDEPIAAGQPTPWEIWSAPYDPAELEAVRRGDPPRP